MHCIISSNSKSEPTSFSFLALLRNSEVTDKSSVTGKNINRLFRNFACEIYRYKVIGKLLRYRVIGKLVVLDFVIQIPFSFT